MLSQGDEKMEWRLLDTVDFAEIESKEYDLDGVTEIFLYGNLLKCESDIASGIRATINGIDIGLILDTAKSSSSAAYQYGYAKYNGLFWDVRVSSPALLKTNYTLNAINARHPYNVPLDVGTVNKLKVSASSSAYLVASGTLEIYVR